MNDKQTAEVNQKIFFILLFQRIKWWLMGSTIFSHLGSCPSWHRSVYHFWATGRCANISIAIWIRSQSCFSTDFSSSEKPVVIAPLGIGRDTNYAKFLSFFYSKFSLGIFKFFAASQSGSLSLLLRFLFRDPLFICSTCHCWNGKMVKCWNVCSSLYVHIYRKY